MVMRPSVGKSSCWLQESKKPESAEVSRSSLYFFHNGQKPDLENHTDTRIIDPMYTGKRQITVALGAKVAGLHLCPR